MKRLVALMMCAVSLGAAAQFPNLPYNPDENGDGLIGVGDLQAFLTVYNTNFAPFDLDAASDNESALLHLGIKNRLDCERDCSALPGPWNVMSVEAMAIHHDFVFEILPSSAEAWIESLALEGTTIVNKYLRGSGDFMDQAGVNINDEVNGDDDHCFCFVRTRPKVEYAFCNGPWESFLECTSEKTNLGWYPSGDISPESTAGHFVQAFWRWAE